MRLTDCTRFLSPSPLLLGALLATLPCCALRGAAEGGSESRLLLPSTTAAGGTTVVLCPTTTVVDRSAWIAPAVRPFPPRIEVGVSTSIPPWESCAMSVPGHNDGGGDGARAGNEGTGPTGQGGGRANREGHPAPGGGMDGVGGSVGSGNGKGGGKGGGGGGSGATAAGPGAVGGGGDASSAAALERQFSKPAAPDRGGVSEGLGKGAPSPRQRLRLQQESLELRWKMAQKRDTTVCCRQCAGQGVCECRFCAGTGLFKIGEELIVHPTGGRPTSCPVCKNKGEEVCSRCKGAGRIAAWLLRSKRAGGISEDRG